MRQELDKTYQECRPQLRAYILRITANAVDTDDIVQETYLKAVAALPGFRGQSTLKTWLFTIATNLAKDNQRFKKRWTEDVTDIAKQAALNNRKFFAEAMEIRMTSPQGAFEIREHIAFCFTCIAKSLPIEQQVALLLKEVHGFKVKEIAEIMGVSEAMGKYYLHVGRSKMIELFDRRCALINKEGVCHQCTELNGIFNPKQNAQEELMKIDMAREADKQDKQQLFDLRMQIVQAIDPFESGAAELQRHHLEHNRQVMEAHLNKEVA